VPTEDHEPVVPPQVLALSLAALDLHDPTLRVARLAADSLLDPQLRAATAGDRRLLFAADEFSADVTLRPSPTTPGHLDLLVTLRPQDGGPARYQDVDHVEVVQPDRRSKVALTRTEGSTDAFAEGELAGLRPGLTSLLVPGPAGSGAPAVRTAWFTA
jgi:hypothetical protein